MKTINVELTAEVIDEMANRANDLAKQLTRIAKEIRVKDNIEYASDAHGAVFTFLFNARLDLLITRPLREFMREV